MSLVWEMEALGASEKLVLLALADHANDDGTCYPGNSRLAKRTGMTGRGVQKVIQRLVGAGLLLVDPNAGLGGANVYRLFLTPEHSSPTPPEHSSPPNDVHPRTTFTTPPNHVPFTPEPRSPKPSLTINEPREEPPLVPPKAARRRKAALPDDWQPSQRNIEDAEAKGFSAEEIKNEAQQFRDHHHAKGTTFADCDAGWRTWLGNARKFGSRMAGKANAPRGRSEHSMASIAARNRMGYDR